MIDQRIARYEYSNTHPRTPCTAGHWQAGAYVQCEGPRLYEARWRRLIGKPGDPEGRYVPDRGLLCEPHARSFCQRWRLHMPGEEPKDTPEAPRPQNGPLRRPQRHGNGEGSIPALASASVAGTAVCAPCFPAWGSYAAGTVHVPSPGGCSHGCHQQVVA